MRFTFATLLTVVLACRSAPPPPDTTDTPRQTELLEFIDILDEVFAERYAPAAFKAERFAWDRSQEISRLKAAVSTQPELSKEDFQRLLRSFFVSMRDIHTGISFDNTKVVWLGLHVRTAGDSVLIAWIDRSLLPEADFPYEVGDELVSFDGQDPSKALAEVTEQTGYRSTPDFERSFAEWFLTVRATSEWPSIPAPGATVQLQLRRRAASAVTTHSLQWIDMDVTAPSSRCAFWGKTPQGYLPPFAPPKWRGGKTFAAYTFVDGDTLIGSIRIPSYGFGPQESVKALKEFDATLDAFVEQGVKKLIIDQTGNGGGNFLFGFALMSRLVDRDLSPPLQHYLMTANGDVVGLGSQAMFAGMLQQVDKIQSDSEAQEFMAKSPIFTGGLNFAPKELVTLRNFASFVRFFVEQPLPQSGTALTKLHFQVQQSVAPRATAKGSRFTGPIVVLIDEMNLSAAEYVAATFKDNGRATLVGVRTAGAGGDQRGVHRDRICSPTTPDDPFARCVSARTSDLMKTFGITSFRYTTSLGTRVKRSGEVIGPFENTGVGPDVELKIEASDLVDGFKNYRERVLQTLRRAS